MTSDNVYQIDQRLEGLQRKHLHKGGQPPYDGGMEARIAKLEVAVDYISRDIGEIKTDIKEIKKDAREDFRILAGMIIALALGMAAMMAKGFNWL